MLGQSSLPEKQEEEMLTQPNGHPRGMGLSQRLMSWWDAPVQALPGSPCSFLRPKPCSSGNPA